MAKKILYHWIFARSCTKSWCKHGTHYFCFPSFATHFPPHSMYFRYILKIQLLLSVLHSINEECLPQCMSLCCAAQTRGFRQRLSKPDMWVTMPQLTSRITANLGIIAANTAIEESWLDQAIVFWLKSIWKCLLSIYNHPAVFIHRSPLLSYHLLFLAGFQQLKKILQVYLNLIFQNVMQ